MNTSHLVTAGVAGIAIAVVAYAWRAISNINAQVSSFGQFEGLHFER